MKFSIYFTFLFASILLMSAEYGSYKYKIPESADNISHERFAIDIAHPAVKSLTLPSGGAAIKAISKGDSESLYGVTTGSENDVSPMVFCFDLMAQELTDYRAIEAIDLHGQQFSNQITQSVPFTGTYGKDKTGRLIEIKEEKGKLLLRDNGPIQKNRGVYTLKLSKDKKEIYGILYPNNAFFVYTINTGKTVIYEETQLSKESLALGERHHNAEALLCKELGMDKSGRVYGNSENGKIFRYDPNTRHLEITSESLPGNSYRRVACSWTLAENGNLYGGTTINGLLFELNPETLSVRNLGKLYETRNVNGLIADDGTIYGITGNYPEQSHGFCYDIEKRTYSYFGHSWNKPGRTVYWMLPLNATSRTNGNLSDIVNLQKGWAIISESDFFPSLLFIKLK